MRVLVTGGGGFLGAALARALATRGDRAIAFDRQFAPALEALAETEPNLVLRRGDILDSAALGQLFAAERPQAVLHCAAVVGVVASLAGLSEVFRTNIEGAVTLFDTMVRHAVRRVFHISSEEVYGVFRADRIDEEHPMNPLYAYGISKAAVEQLGRSYYLSDDLECINLRTSWVYGPGFPRMRVPRDLVEAALAGRALHLAEGGDSKIDHTYIDDVVRGALQALDCVEHGFDAYHIASDSGPTLAEMVAVIRDLVPGADISIGGGAYRHAGQIEAPRKGALDCSRAGAAFGYKPRFDLRAGLAAYVESCRAAA